MDKIFVMGCNGRHPGDFSLAYPNGDCYLLLLTFTAGEFMVDGEFVRCPANSAILFKPYQYISYRGCEDAYEDDWMHFHTSEKLITDFPLIGQPFTVSDPDSCHRLFQLLTWESYQHEPSSETVISHLLQVMFLKLRRDADQPQDNRHISELLALRRSIFNNPQNEWSLEQMARDLHMSVGYLQVLYKRNFGTTCMDDVIEGRVRTAKQKLLYSSASVQEIAPMCGYRNVEHFCRQFKKYTGMSPGSFRKQNRQLSDSSASFAGES